MSGWLVLRVTCSTAADDLGRLILRWLGPSLTFAATAVSGMIMRAATPLTGCAAPVPIWGFFVLYQRSLPHTESYSLPWLAAVPELQRKQNLTRLSPERGLVTAEPVEGVCRQIRQADERACEVVGLISMLQGDFRAGGRVVFCETNPNLRRKPLCEDVQL
jgi:hypothetical protein